MGLDMHANNMLIIRCPNCHRRQCDAFLTGDSFLVIVCRCHAKFRVDKDEVFPITMAASVTRSFDGRNYDSTFGLAIR
jgi:hypothetical protein